MRTELLSVAKYRDASRPGDDVALIIPGLAYGVFDGATDARGTVVDGIPAGRLASLTVAQEMTRAVVDPATRDASGPAIIARLAAALVARTERLGLPIPPSTTLSVVLDCGSEWRFLSLGDSGFRLNGTEILRREKIIDDVSTAARVQMFGDFAAQMPGEDLAEMAARRGILLGLDNAVAEGVLAPDRVREIIAATITATGLGAHGALVEEFLRGGIQTQNRFANATGSALCFDTMNGGIPQLGELIDERRSKASVSSIEIFSDGYPDMPTEVSADAWEVAFQAAELADYHKTGTFATVKGSTRAEYFDDRTVLVLSDL